MMDAQDELLLSELIDGRPVDPDRLEALLDSRAARESLVAFVRLRSELAADVAMPSPGFADRVEARLAAPRGRTALGRLGLVAAGLLIGVLVTSALRTGAPGGGPAGQLAADDMPPPAARVVEFELGTEWKESQS